MFKAVISGRLTKDAVLNEYNGRSVARFDVATETAFKDENSAYITNFISVSVWGNQGNACSRLTKGQRVLVTGSLGVKPYHKQDGSTGYAVNLNADSVEFLSPPQNHNNQQQAPRQQYQPQPQQDDLDELFSGK